MNEENKKEQSTEWQELFDMLSTKLKAIRTDSKEEDFLAGIVSTMVDALIENRNLVGLINELILNEEITLKNCSQEFVETYVSALSLVLEQ